MNPAIIACLYLTTPQPLAVTWPLQGLNKELTFIAKQESYYGKYLNHEPHSKGPFHTAFGSLGLKPSTAHDTYIKSPWLKARFPGLEGQSAFLNRFWHDAELYIYTANFHWHSLRQNTENIQRAVFSWRWGLGASNKATDSEIEQDSYVMGYTALEKTRTDALASARR